MTAYYPSFISFDAEHASEITAAALAAEYARCLADVGRGEIVAYSLPAVDSREATGGVDDLVEVLRSRGDAWRGSFTMATADQMRMELAFGVGGRQVWEMNARFRSEALRPDAAWMKAMGALAVRAVGLPGFRFAVLRRKSSWADFVPQPPLARVNHVVTTTDTQIAERYDNAEVFVAAWDHVERVGGALVCLRALDCIDERDWLGSTFESTMELARHARPNLTYYDPPDFREELAPWWKYGDLIAEDRAGYPALTLVGYEPQTRTIEFTGYVTDTPLIRGGPDPRHVLIQEIHEVRALVASRRNREGRPVDCVRIVFPERWMAQRERRPLRDVGARVFYTDRKTGELVEIAD